MVWLDSLATLTLPCSKVICTHLFLMQIDSMALVGRLSYMALHVLKMRFTMNMPRSSGDVVSIHKSKPDDSVSTPQVDPGANTTTVSWSTMIQQYQLHDS
ncbi:hypothetical protein Nepgr_001016 [Nepenthes gracilis]|uniref:Uncharacterized protein n=1 Tax=Nepenthes gracilis TaxID=150966 RepID=A0AAD3RVT4_NEPGR|nr:hypothetical protein Nepgr_001016 [Nepenthes gracilis]